MKRQRNIQQVKEYDKYPPNQTKDEEIGSLPEKEFIIVIVKMTQNLENKMVFGTLHSNGYAAAAAKSLQLCPTLCDPIDGSGREFEQAPGVGDGKEAWHAAVHGVAKCQTQLTD